MQIRRAHPDDISGINHLMSQYDITPVYKEQINGRDISIVAEDMDEIIGFVWVGLMGKNTRGFIDHFVVHTNYAKQGIGNKMALRAMRVLQHKGVKHISGVICPTQYHENSAMNALKVAMGAYPNPVTYVFMDVARSVKELGI